MDIVDARADVREVYASGAYGQLVAGGIWLLAAGMSIAVSHAAGIVVLLVGGAAILPITMLLLKLRGGPTSLPAGHPMAALAVQIAFTVPMGLLVAVAAAGYREDWFFPASMVIVGAHYLPFTFLYGTALFSVLGGLMALGGVALALWLPNTFSTGGFVTGVLLIAFAVLLGRAHRREQGRSTRAPTAASDR